MIYKSAFKEMGVSMKFYVVWSRMNLIINKRRNIASGLNTCCTKTSCLQMNSICLFWWEFPITCFWNRRWISSHERSLYQPILKSCNRFLVTRWISIHHATMIAWHRVIVSPVGVASKNSVVDLMTGVVLQEWRVDQFREYYSTLDML